MSMPTVQDLDAKGLQEIAQRRSHEAFEELFSRYESLAFGLAFHLTGDRDAALDVVQQAMLDVWKNAARFDPERGSALKWILRIVANTALRCRRDARREKQRTSAAPPDTLAAEDRIGAERDGPEEVLKALSGVLGSLPEADRRLIALYYGAGLSQYEIARALAMSQRTVSYKMTHLVDQIRKRLSRLGFASLSAAAFASSISSAICLGPALPVRLPAGVLAALRAPRPSRQGRRRPVLGRLLLIGLASLAGLGATLGSVWRLYAVPPRAVSNLADGGRGMRAGPARPGPLGPSRYHSSWVFNFPAPEDVFQVVRGSWTHVPPAGSRVAGYMLNKEPVTVELRLPPLRRPFAVSARVYIPGDGGHRVFEGGKEFDRYSMLVGPGLGDTLEGGQIVNYCQSTPLDPHPVGWCTYRKIFAGDFEEGCIDGRLSVLCYRIAKDNARLYLQLEGSHHIAGIEVGELSAEETPDFDALRAAIQAVPKSRRKGLVPLPGLTPLEPSRPVGVAFLEGLGPLPE